MRAFACFLPIVLSSVLVADGPDIETYKIVEKHELALHIFRPSGHVPSQDSRPAIVFFFGGGWVGGNPLSFILSASIWPSGAWWQSRRNIV